MRLNSVGSTEVWNASIQLHGIDTIQMPKRLESLRVGAINSLILISDIYFQELRIFKVLNV